MWKRPFDPIQGRYSFGWYACMSDQHLDAIAGATARMGGYSLSSPIGTFTYPRAPACPQLKEADIRPKTADSGLVFAALAQLRARGLVIGADPLFNSLPDQLVALAARHAVPTIYQFREFVEAGGLMSYGSSLTDTLRLVGVYAGRISQGHQAGRSAGDTADQIRVRRQSEDCKVAPARNSTKVTRLR
jgi:hypothetical protein